MYKLIQYVEARSVPGYVFLSVHRVPDPKERAMTPAMARAVAKALMAAADAADEGRDARATATERPTGFATVNVL